MFGLKQSEGKVASTLEAARAVAASCPGNHTPAATAQVVAMRPTSAAAPTTPTLAASAAGHPGLLLLLLLRRRRRLLLVLPRAWRHPL